MAPLAPPLDPLLGNIVNWALSLGNEIDKTISKHSTNESILRLFWMHVTSYSPEICSWHLGRFSIRSLCWAWPCKRVSNVNNSWKYTLNIRGKGFFFVCVWLKVMKKSIRPLGHSRSTYFAMMEFHYAKGEMLWCGKSTTNWSSRSTSDCVK